jgi:hypothetical protein
MRAKSRCLRPDESAMFPCPTCPRKGARCEVLFEIDVAGLAGEDVSIGTFKIV